MPRKPRVLVDGGCYHIVTRGIERRRLFRCSQDYTYFLEVVRKYLEKFKIGILHYCLMSNHLHLIIQAKKRKTCRNSCRQFYRFTPVISGRDIALSV